MIFLGWQSLAAEFVGGVLLITISSLIIKTTYTRRWIDEVREHLEEQGGKEDDFNWKQRGSLQT